VAVSGQLSIPADLPPWEKFPVLSEEKVVRGPESRHLGHVKDPFFISGIETQFLSCACPNLTNKPTTLYGLPGLGSFSKNAETEQFYQENELSRQLRE
jgi:hypothetical protein